MDPIALRLAAAFALATATALWLDAEGERRGLSPPGWREPWRRAAASVVVAGVLLLAVFLPVATFGVAPEPELAELRLGDLFLGQELLLTAVALWVALGWLGVGASAPTALADSLGLRAARPLRELALGLGFGVGAWLGVLALVYAVAIVLELASGGRWLDGMQQAPPEVVWMAALPLGWKLALSCSAGLSEEIFFRGFLQRRLGLAASTLCFVLAHLSYAQPFMLLGVAALSLLYGSLTRRRGNVWAAVVAHAFFDAVQLVVIIPAALSAAPSAAQP